MDELHRTADKLATDAKHLASALDEDTQLALTVAKRVRRTSTLLVQQLAALRDTQR